MPRATNASYGQELERQYECFHPQFPDCLVMLRRQMRGTGRSGLDGWCDCLAPAPAAAQTPSVLLGAEDELRIRIYQWPELSGDYVIGARGNVSLPLVGPIPAAGITEEDLAGRISDVLKARARLTDAPTTAVEVAQYRPFYIMGDVDRPGAFPYRPGMLVLNAVSLAGGYYRKTEQAWQRFERDALSAAGDSRELADQIARQTLRIVRLEAERDGLDSFTVPLELRYGGDVQALAEQEQALLRSRSETLRMQLEEYAAVSEELTTHIALVEAQDRERTAELNLTDARIERLETLAAKRLVSEVELMALQAQASNIRREQIQLNVQVLEAKTRQRELADAATSLNHDHMGEVLTSLQAAPG